MADAPKPPIALEQRAVEGAMLFSPSAGRNKDAIAQVLAELLPQGAHVLEIGSGTGEHAESAVQARPDLSWTPSDPDDASRASCAARAEISGGRIHPPLNLDLTRPGWLDDALRCDAIFCANTIHISPWSVAEGLAAGAESLLGAEGRVILYGPFLNGADSAPSNLKFSENLKARDASWGVRERTDVEALFAARGFALARVIDMPANNHMLLFERRAARGEG